MNNFCREMIFFLKISFFEDLTSSVQWFSKVQRRTIWVKLVLGTWPCFCIFRGYETFFYSVLGEFWCYSLFFEDSMCLSTATKARKYNGLMLFNFRIRWRGKLWFRKLIMSHKELWELGRGSDFSGQVSFGCKAKHLTSDTHEV